MTIGRACSLFTFLLVIGCGSKPPTEPSTTEPSTTEPSTTEPPTTEDQDGDGFEAGPDCDDGDDQIHPGADEICGGGDEDCDGTVDEGDAVDASTWYADDDADGHGSDVSVTGCVQPADHVTDSDDCDDTTAAVSPDAVESCATTADDDCDGTANEDDASDALTWYADDDADGYGSDVSVTACALPADHVDNSDDCDDTSAGVSPAATETCDGVDTDCDGTVDFGYSVPQAFATIQGAIAAAGNGDHVCVAPGTYVENLYLTLYLEELVIEGYAGPEVTIIDGGGVGPVVVKEDGYLELRGLTLRNGYGDGYLGSAGFAGLGGDSWLEDVIIEDNVGVDTAGAALYGVAGTITLTDVEIRNNTASGTGSVMGSTIYVLFGALTMDRVAVLDNASTCADVCVPVLYVGHSSVDARNVVIAGNTGIPSDAAAYMAGLLILIGGATLDLENATIAHNWMDAGADIVAGTLHTFEAYDVAVLQNVVIAENDHIGTGGLTAGGIYAGGPVTVTYSDVYGNSSPEWSGVPDPTGTSGNVSVDPLFTDVTSADPLLWDLTLAAGSPLVDVGDPAVLDSDGSTSDVGAYGGPGGDDW